MSKNDLLKYKCPNCYGDATFIMDYCEDCGYVDDNAPWVRYPGERRCPGCGNPELYQDAFDTQIGCPKCGLVVCSDGLEYYMWTRGGVVE